MYDVSSRESFNSLANWLTDARTLASPAIVILLVGNKKDLEEENRRLKKLYVEAQINAD